MPSVDEVADAVERRLRAAEWVTGPNGQVESREAWAAGVRLSAQLAADRAAYGDIRNQSTVFVRDEPGFGKEWARVDATLPPLETNAAVDGFRVTTDEATARLWALAASTQQFARSSFRPIPVTRAEYIALQAQWRQNARDWRAAVALAVKGA